MRPVFDKTSELKRITCWLNPQNNATKGEVVSVKTKYGVVDNHTWLKLEKVRIEKDGKRCEILKDKTTGQEALFYVDGYYRAGTERNTYGWVELV